MKNASKEGDSGLIYLREARNVEMHGLSPFADFRSPAVVLGNGAISVGGDSRLIISNCSFDGVPSGTFELQTKAGRIRSLRGDPNITLHEKPTSVRLNSVYNEDNRKRADVPTFIGGERIPNDPPSNLAEMAQALLEKKYEELLEIWQKSSE